MDVQVKELHHDGQVELIRIFHDVTELKEIADHTGDFNGITDEIHEYYRYYYEVWSHDKKLGIFYGDETEVQITLNETEQLQ